jgi:hypothetical protein
MTVVRSGGNLTRFCAQAVVVVVAARTTAAKSARGNLFIGIPFEVF